MARRVENGHDADTKVTLAIDEESITLMAINKEEEEEKIKDVGAGLVSF
jgi:hypothetical protein